MLRGWLRNIGRKWQILSGGLAVLLMFFIPVTREVLAAGEVLDLNNGVNDAKGKEKSQPRVTDNTGVSSGTSQSGPTTPANPSPMNTGGSTSGADPSSKISLGDTGGGGDDIVVQVIPPAK